MSAVTDSGVRACPGCGGALRPEGRYCPACGLEVCQFCPACGAAPRPLVPLDPGTGPWCAGCDTLLDACERCGRWLLPGRGVCPDPQCLGRVLPTRPVHTGRRWDGRGGGVGWRWPGAWERENPAHSAPIAAQRKSTETLQAAFVAHGALYLWEGTALVIPSSDWNAPAATTWRSPLGPNSPPAAVAYTDRVAVAGSRAVLARESRFLAVDLRHPADTSPLEGGVPVAQVAGPGWWVGWSREPEGPVLRVARVADAAELLQPVPVATCAAALPAPHARLALRDGRAFWPAVDGGVWGVDCVTQEVTRWIAPPARPDDGRACVWAETDGPRVAREALGQVTVTLSAPREGRSALLAPAGRGPLAGVYATGNTVVVAGDKLLLFDAQTGELQDEAARPPGRWVDAALVPGPDTEPRLLLLTVEGGVARVSALRIASGTQTVVWEGRGLEPRTLLPVGDTLYVTLADGVLRLLV